MTEEMRKTKEYQLLKQGRKPMDGTASMDTSDVATAAHQREPEHTEMTAMRGENEKMKQVQKHCAYGFV